MDRKPFSFIAGLALVAAFSANPVHAQTNAPDAVVIYVVPDSDTGLSAKKALLGKAVYSDDKKKIGTITDLIIAPDTSVAYVVVGAGGFVGLGRHNVAVQTSALRVDDGKFVLPGATKESLKAAPKLEYPKKRG
ncbi:MAG TPA: PRC-barrel domain-containing protein [Burkholderiales bacterium]|nr:PRC-barrel domain-containing protein [Burkholderiales bacterium]